MKQKQKRKGKPYYNRLNSTIERHTPLHLFQKWSKEFPFTTDPCADSNNRLGCKVYFTKETDGLKNIDKWQGIVFINPPYNGKGTVERWIKAALTYNERTRTSLLCFCELLQALAGFKIMYEIMNITDLKMACKLDSYLADSSLPISMAMRWTRHHSILCF